MTETDLYGQGISFPLRVGPDGGIVWSSGELNVRNASGKAVYQARLDTPYAILQSLRAGVPSLVMTYAQQPSALDSLQTLSASELSAARYDIVLFNDRGIAYTNPAEMVEVKRAPPSPLRSSWPLIVLFGVVVVVGLALIARRARRVS